MLNPTRLDGERTRSTWLELPETVKVIYEQRTDQLIYVDVLEEIIWRDEYGLIVSRALNADNKHHWINIGPSHKECYGAHRLTHLGIDYRFVTIDCHLTELEVRSILDRKAKGAMQDLED